MKDWQRNVLVFFLAVALVRGSLYSLHVGHLNAQGLLTTGAGRKIVKEQAASQPTKIAAPPQGHPCMDTNLNPLGEQGGWLVPGNVYQVRLMRPLKSGDDQVDEIDRALGAIGLCNVIEGVSFTTRGERIGGVTEAVRAYNDTMIVVLHHKPEYDVPKSTR